MSFTPVQHQAWLTSLVQAAREAPDGRVEIRDESGAVVLTCQSHAVAKRPKDMPRALRPKAKLSKRQRVQARLAKLAA